MKKQKNLIFDVDGVMLLSTQPGMEGIRQAAEFFGLNKPPFSEIKKHWGKKLEEGIIPALGDLMGWSEQQRHDVLQKFLALSRTTMVYPEQPELMPMLIALKQQGYRLGVITNRDPESLYFRFNQHKIHTHLFEHIHVAHNGNAIKPSPRVFDQFIKLGFNPADTLFIGDSVADDLAAAIAHEPPFKFAGIISGVSSMAEFVKAGVPVTHIFKNVTHVQPCLHYLL